MIVNTRRLFTTLLSRLQISAVCDVGSMNGADALAFRATVPQSSIYALEPNPHNFRRMAADPVLHERNIRVEPLAATNYDGQVEFYVIEADDSQPDHQRGRSSLYRRPYESYPPSSVVRVETTRLDTYLADKCTPEARFALWIDTEGKAYEVIEGAAGVVDHVHLLHVEVETKPLIGADQKLYPEVRALAHRLGFVELARDQPRDCEQFNVLYVRRDLPPGIRLALQTRLLRAGVRQLLVKVGLRLCPACMRRYHAMRLRQMSRPLPPSTHQSGR
jgi:FkbM family methyltransferase